MRRIIYTLGHSNRSLEEFLDILRHYSIEAVADVRRFPSSRKFPHFNKDNLRRSLISEGIEYHWFGELGGKRGYIPGAEKYKCFRAEGYRNYVALMQTEEWRRAFNELVSLATNKVTVVLCAERIPWRCHRKLISDALLARGFVVIHIIDKGKEYQHRLTKCAKIVNGKLEYL